MMMKILKLTTILTLLGGIALAQEERPLILDEEPQISVRVRPRDDAANQQEEEPEPTPNPEEVMVAIVNAHVLTRADLDARVAQRYDKLKAEVQAQHGGVLTVLGDAQVDMPNTSRELRSYDVEWGEPLNQATPTPRAPSQADRDAELLESQRAILEAALRKEEGKVIGEWVDHNVLADEARRQGIMVTESEFQSRLAQAERESLLKKEQVDEVLQMMRFSRQDYEKAVYDALCIEKLLNRFIDINYDEAYLRERYEARPSLYMEPAGYKVAHFVITLEGTENRDKLKDLREKAKDVRDKLKEGADAYALFENPNYNQIQAGIYGTVLGWFSFDEGHLPPLVEYEAKKMKVGETSDVLLQEARVNGEIEPRSLHVVKILEHRDATGDTFESALPSIRRAMLEIARIKLAERLRTTGTHRVITNLGGIPPKYIPSTEEVMAYQNADPISLKMPVAKHQGKGNGQQGRM